MVSLLVGLLVSLLVRLLVRRQPHPAQAVCSLWRKTAAAGLSAAVYTQLSDVETELNGLLTYDPNPNPNPNPTTLTLTLTLTLT